MKIRPVKNPEPHLARAVDPTAAPGRALSLPEELADAGVPPDGVVVVEKILYREAYKIAAESVRRLMLALESHTAGVALRRVVLGPEGRALERDAKIAGTDHKTLARSEARIRRRLSRKMKIGPGSSQ